MRDSQRSKVYAAESLVHNIFDHAANGSRELQMAGATLTVPPEAKFASIESVRHYLDRALGIVAVRERFARVDEPVTVRARRGGARADYERTPDGGVIAVPMAAKHQWAQRELVVLHELAHHLDEDALAHGPSFVATYVDLVGLVMGPEAALILRITLADNDVRIG